MALRVFGQVKELETQKAISGLIVEAMDADLFFDDFLGRAKTDSDGCFSIACAEGDASGVFEDKPDVYVVVKADANRVLKTTRNNVLQDVTDDTEINVEIPRSILVYAGLVDRQPAPWMRGVDPQDLEKFTIWTFLEDYDAGDVTLAQIQGDMEGKASILEVLDQYMKALRKEADNNAPEFTKMAKLFELGITPDQVEGHFYGVPLGLRSGEGNLADMGNVLGLLWGATLGDESPWVGKSFAPADADKLDAICFDSAKPEGKAYLGINHFNKIDFRVLNTMSLAFLNWWMGLASAPLSEQETFGHDRNGGHFVASRGRSVYPATDREVFLLNYRWKNLGNSPPLCWLIDEMVQVAEGLYLGQLLFATRRMLRDYDPTRPPAGYQYEHFGYFVLFDRTWNAEARRLFPFLEIPVTAPGLVDVQVTASFRLPRYSTFTFEDDPHPLCDDGVFLGIKEDMRDKPTIMHLLKTYSDALQDDLDNESPHFHRMQELFNRGIGIRELRGFYRGALVTWHAAGLLECFDVNTLNLAWMGLARKFSTWTGKTFEDIPVARLRELTDGYERGDLPTFWGANTQSLRDTRERFVGGLMKLADVWTESVPPDEAMRFGYDVKNFFFIAHQARSVNPDNKDKDIFQFNYRWPKLRTVIPDRFCLDELVQIADGLYLGQLMYATEVLKPYDPEADPSDYKYGLFGYFLLMDEGWHQIRLQIGFDLTNV